MLLFQKNILVTGASSGIGRAVSVEAAKQGARVLLIARDLAKLEETKRALERPQEHLALSIDLLSHNVEAILQVQLRNFGRIDGFVHAAGISPTQPLKLIRQNDLDNCFRINVYAALFLTQLLLNSNIRSLEAFSAVYISSVVSEVGDKGKVLYSMSKSALVGMSKSLAIEYANKKARFNCISPGVVDTPLSNNSLYRKDEDAMREVLGKHPLGLGLPTDVAHAAVFLLSNQSRWITGINMPVDGGYLAK